MCIYIYILLYTYTPILIQYLFDDNNLKYLSSSTNVKLMKKTQVFSLNNVYVFVNTP